MAILTLSSIVAAGLIVNGNPNAVFQFRPVDNSSNLNPPSGTFANLQLNQLASNGLPLLLVTQGIYLLGYYFSSSQSQKKLRPRELKWIRAPIKKKFVDFGDLDDRISRVYAHFDVPNSSV